jgi:hypothetical protein
LRRRPDARRGLRESSLREERGIIQFAIIGTSSGDNEGRFEMLNQTEIALAAVLVLATTSTALAKGHAHPGGNVRPCSLDGVNPVYHPQIFGSAAIARTYGFVQSPDQTWHVDQRLCEGPHPRSM